MRKVLAVALVVSGVLSGCQHGREVAPAVNRSEIGSSRQSAQLRPAYIPVFVQQVFKLTNEARSVERKCGDDTYKPAPALVFDMKLYTSAQNHAEDMAKNSYFSNTGRDKVTFQKRISNTGYLWKWVGENIGRGHNSPATVVSKWLANKSQCTNIMNPNAKHIGIGYAQSRDSYGQYWVQDFGQPK